VANPGLAACREVLEQRLADEAMRASEEADRREQHGDDGRPLQGRELLCEDPAPWSEPVDGAVLLDEILGTLRRYVVLPAHADVAMALWIVHSYALDCIDFSARLILTSAEKRSRSEEHTSELQSRENLVCRLL